MQVTFTELSPLKLKICTFKCLQYTYIIIMLYHLKLAFLFTRGIYSWRTGRFCITAALSGTATAVVEGAGAFAACSPSLSRHVLQTGHGQVNRPIAIMFVSVNTKMKSLN